MVVPVVLMVVWLVVLVAVMVAVMVVGVLSLTVVHAMGVNRGPHARNLRNLGVLRFGLKKVGFCRVAARTGRCETAAPSRRVTKGDPAVVVAHPENVGHLRVGLRHFSRIAMAPSTTNGSGAPRRVLPRARSDDMEGHAFWSEPGSPSSASEDFDHEGKYDSQVQSYIPISVQNLLQSLYEDIVHMGANTAVDIGGAWAHAWAWKRFVSPFLPRRNVASPRCLAAASPRASRPPRWPPATTTSLAAA